jgi:ABC-type transport system involved in cytochrome c biogenesis permease subunit
VQALASLRFTVILFSLAMVLVFFGTLGMMHESIEETMKRYFRSWFVMIDLRAITDFGKVFLGFGETAYLPGKFPFPGGYVIGWLMFVNLAAAHAVRFKLTWKRSGIFLLHAGVIVLLAGEFFTGQFAQETRMMIREGDSSRYMIHLNDYELAVVDPSSPDHDDVVVVPGELILEKGKSQWASHPDLPFDVQLVEEHPNARLKGLKPDEKPVATKGMGLHEAIDPQPKVKGTDSGGDVNYPALYLTLRDKSGADLGTYLFSTLSERQQDVTVGGKTYKVSYRFQRDYKPYTVIVDKAENDFYPGTDIPKDYASTVRVIDPESGEYGPVRIWMNHPMYYKGETFYQSSMSKPDDLGKKITGLQVVVNPAWTFPYFACTMVGLGLAFHFLLRLVTFLQNRSKLAGKPGSPARTTAVAQSNAMRLLGKFFPFGVVALMAIMLIARANTPSPSDKKMDYYGYGKIAVQSGGRTQPLSSLAQNTLMVISGKQEFVDATDKDRTYSAIEWLLMVWAKSDKAEKFRIFRIEHPSLLQLMDVPQRPGSYRYSFAELEPKLTALEGKASEAARKPKEKRTLVDEKAMELAKHIETYRAVQFRKNPGIIPSSPYGGKWTSYGDIVETEAPAFFGDAEKKVREEMELEKQQNPSMIQELVSKLVGGPEDIQAAIKRFGGPEKLIEAVVQEEVRFRSRPVARANFLKMLPEKYPQGADFEKILDTYKADDTPGFNKAVAEYHEKYDGNISDSDRSRVSLEAWMNHADPFLYCMVCYVAVVVLAALSWLVWHEPLRRSAFWLAVFTLAIHTSALIARMYIGNRPPVTNLYSSAIFIGWGGLALCLITELIYKLGIGSFAGAAFGFCTMLIARFLAESGDTLEMLQAVLDTNFWLATHVTCVTAGYFATAVAGFFGIAYIFAGVFTTAMRGNVGKVLSSMIYGIVCFAMLMSFVGTVLGGIWADQSWGRFWGWDPKENGAVLIVIWNALILHARWCGWAKARGVAVLSVVGMMWTAWSWFGTNQLGIGLHAYGFDNRLAMGCSITWLALSLVVVLGLIPLKYWASFAQTTVPAKA